mgnify:FL=1
MSGQTILSIVMITALVVWIGELIWLYREAEETGRDPVEVVSGAAVFFVLAVPVARSAPAIVDQLAAFWERLVTLDFSGRPPRDEPRLVVDGRVFPLRQNRVRIGRYGNNDLVLDHPTVSSYHAEIIRRADGRHEIIDQQSRNGVRINGTPVQSGVLHDGDQITLGATTLRYFSGESHERERARPIGARDSWR